MTKLKYILFLFFVIAIPIIIYLYFLPWKTSTMYGDDLYLYKTHASLHSFSEKINIPGLFQKYRPVHGLSMHVLLETFHKNLNGYCCFNIAIQVINTFLFALIINFFLKSLWLSLLCGLSLGLSRFSYFNITQLFNGGALEGLAIAFFLLFLYYVIRAMAFNLEPKFKQQNVIKAIVFANLCMYTHERYIVLLPFIILLILIYPGFKILRQKQKIVLSLLAVASICLNVFLKKEIYNMPFFVGTGGTNIELSTSSPLSFLNNGLLSIFGMNKGPDYLSGLNFNALPLWNKLIVIFLLAGFFISFFIYFKSYKKAININQNEHHNKFWLLPFLWMLLVLLLIPAVITIRLEQRWLQASFAVFMLSFIIAFCQVSFKNLFVRNWILVLFMTLFFLTDYTYLSKGAGNIYLTTSEATADKFKEAIDKRIIKPQTKNIYVWEKHQDVNVENEIKWILAEGYFFNFYQRQGKNMFFADSIYTKDSVHTNTFTNFNTNADQIIFMDTSITDITNNYLKDSLKEFTNKIHH